MKTTTDSDGAKANAKGWYETIKEQLAALKGHEKAAKDAGWTQFTDESAREAIQEGPLSVMVRDGWRSPGAEMRAGDGPEEFEILLTTGGPALRIWGTLSHGQPDECELQIQDWSTPWTKWAPEPYDPEYRDTLRAYASCFYFEES